VPTLSQLRTISSAGGTSRVTTSIYSWEGGEAAESYGPAYGAGAGAGGLLDPEYALMDHPSPAVSGGGRVSKTSTHSLMLDPQYTMSVHQTEL
jgi:hypothetical protein